MSRDITYCSNDTCPLKELCQRNTENKPFLSSVTDFEYNNGCDMFLGDNDSYDKVRLKIKRDLVIKKVLKR